MNEQTEQPKPKKNNVIKTFFLKHQAFTIALASVFFACNIITTYMAIGQSVRDMGNLEKRTGIVRMWSYGRNTGSLSVEGYPSAFKKNKLRGWINLQHRGKKGEKVVFYTIKKETLHTFANDEPHYFGLSNEKSPRSGFWIFFELLFYNLVKNLFFWFSGFLGILWATQYVKNRTISIFAGTLFTIALILYGLAAFS